MTQKEIEKKANELLSRNGFAYDGSQKIKVSKKQLFFEKRIIGTPMGNRMR